MTKVERLKFTGFDLQKTMDGVMGWVDKIKDPTIDHRRKG
jgi:hypothetical protein